jgi:hypothetical protein
MRLVFLSLVFTLGFSALSYCQDCFHTESFAGNDFGFRASSDFGAIGDVIAIELSLGIADVHEGVGHYEMCVAYDGAMAEPIGQPLFSEVHEKYVFWELFEKIPQNYRMPGVTLDAFSIVGLFNNHSADEYFSEGNYLPIATIYFRLIGDPGKSSTIKFSDGEYKLPFMPASCIDNSVSFFKNANDAYDDLKVRSLRNLPGDINAVSGDATHSSVPSIPPLAKVYPSTPTAETENIHFELTGGGVRPGATEVPVNIFVTSNYEFSAYEAAGTFSGQYLKLRRIEDYTRPGIQSIDNSIGEFWMISQLSRWRIGFENERVLVATLYFDVSTDAPVGGILPIELKRIGPADKSYTNWIGINNEGLNGIGVPIVTEAEPIIITQFVMNIRSTENTRIGDANLDRAFDISDPVAVISYLLQGGIRPACSAAADYNTDGRLDIADAISMLTALFLGGSSGGNAPVEVACE